MGILASVMSDLDAGDLYFVAVFAILIVWVILWVKLDDSARVDTDSAPQPHIQTLFGNESRQPLKSKNDAQPRTSRPQ